MDEHTQTSATPDTNHASYELCLALSLIAIMARDGDHDEQNALYAISDCVRRAKSIIDGEESHG